MNMKFLIPISATIFLCATAIRSALAAEYFVSVAGSDENSCTNRTTDSCRTIQKGLSVLAPGDTLNLGQGAYSGNGGRSSFNSSGKSGATSSTGQGNIESAVLVLDRSGTPTQPITVQGDPQNATDAVLDCGHVRDGAATFLGGIFINRQDYVHFKNFTIRNCMARGIYEWDRGNNSADVPDSKYLSIGVRVEGLTIHHIGGGDNDAGIAMWSTKDWVVRNNHIYDIYGWPANGRTGNGIMSYGTVNALVEHNHIEKSAGGVFWKDHYVADAVTREAIFESEIRFNYIDVAAMPIMIGVQPDNEAGGNYIHHNILIGAKSGEMNGIRIHMNAVANPTMAAQRIEHNLILGNSAVDTSAIMLSGVNHVELKANIVFGFKRGLQAQGVSATMPVVLRSSDYNVWGDDLSSVGLLGRYSDISLIEYKTLPIWRAALDSDTPILEFSNPDVNGVAASLIEVLGEEGFGYRLKAGSPAIGLLPDGSNAGPYQYGNEIIGIAGQRMPRPGVSELVAPSSPTSLGVTVLVK